MVRLRGGEGEKWGEVVRVRDPVVSLPNPVFFLSGEFLTSAWAWITRKASDFLNDSNSILFLNFFDFLRRRFFDDDSIVSHCL